MLYLNEYIQHVNKNLKKKKKAENTKRVHLRDVTESYTSWKVPEFQTETFPMF